MGLNTTQTTEDDSNGRLSPEPLEDSSRRFSVPVVDISRRATDLTTSSASTELPYSDDGRSYSIDPRSSLSWGLANSQSVTSSPNTTTEVDIPSCWRRQVVLSLDGGGIHTYAELCILERIFREIAKVERSHDGANSSECSPLFGSPDGYDDEFLRDDPTITDKYLPCHYFNYIGGTSMGGVIAVMIGRLRLSINEAIRNFENMWISIFKEESEFHSLLSRRRIRAGNSEGLRKALNGIVPKPHEDTDGIINAEPFRSDSSLCKTLVLAVQIDRARGVRRPYLFRSYAFNKVKSTAVNRNKSNETEDTPLKDVCLATSATPGFFDSVKIDNKKFRDGSIWMTNPSMELYREVYSMHPDHASPIYCLVSIGCGKQKRSGILSSINMPATSLYKWEQQRVDDVLKSRKKEGEDFEYTRFAGPSDLTDIKPSDWKLEGRKRNTFERIKTATARYCENPEVMQNIKELAERLVKYRRQRARTAHWERFALGVRYSCNWCEEVVELADRDDVIDHVRSKHSDRMETSSLFFNEYRKVLEQFKVQPKLWR
ncbi:FabD/lysophospholipase-like protein [Glonium stellatum]|uniref:FabD/lysophospholipase-like protein n=1 Tax=Glonium stellatum TaxID=574774 RepID=A0A8E2EQC0_9PEZI|nr:FabD/lysophospholipase-like protein [Glonium stellatum]